MSGGRYAEPPVVRVDVDRRARLDRHVWPMTVPAVAQLAAQGLDLDPGVTFLVGENGSGKSTIVEAVAVAYGLSPGGGPTLDRAERRAVLPADTTLGRHVQLQRGAGAPAWGFFLRAETMHGWFTHLAGAGDGNDPAYLAMSHGESFLATISTRFAAPGLYCLDEPEAALSFSSTLGLVSVLAEVADAGGQVLCATHSPVLCALPGATILEVGEWGLRRTAWEDLELVQHWRSFLDGPGRYLRHVLG
jgi:predicted ATPase